MNNSLEYACRYITSYWSFFYFLRPLVLLTIIYCLYHIVKSPNKNRLRQLCIIYLACAGFIFSYIEPCTLVRMLYLQKISYRSMSMFFEYTTSIFQVVEFYIFYSIINLSINDLKLRMLRNFGTSILILLLPIIFHSIHNSKTFQSILFNGEFFAGISNALLLPGFVVFVNRCYKQSIHSTYTMPTILSVFCYVITSLLIYPCTSFLFRDYKNLSFLLYCYHYVVMAIVVLTMKYNVTKIKEGPNKLMTFNIN